MPSPGRRGCNALLATIRPLQSAPRIVAHAGYTVACLDAEGWIDGGSTGLFDYDTRILSRHRLGIDGRTPELVGHARPESERCVATYRLKRDGGDAQGPLLPEDAVELTVDRTVGQGMLERWEITNHSAEPWSGTLRWELDADFADIAEAGRERRQQGEISRKATGRTLEIGYTAVNVDRRFERLLRAHLEGAAGRGRVDDGAIELDLQLQPRGVAETWLRFESKVNGAWRVPGSTPDGETSPGHRRETWRSRRLRAEGPDRLAAPVERAIEDLYALRNRDLERDLIPHPEGRGWVVNAGVPRFTGFFGRDTLTAGWQAAMAGTDTLRGALEVAAATQAQDDDPSRDAEPGKMLHELRRGPLAMLGHGPRDAYFGSQTTPSMFAITLSELWHWTGDDTVLRRFREPALRALDWAARASEATGFLTSVRRAPGGLRNQGWKDSDEAIRHADATIAEPPLATVEEQAFHFLALQRMAEIHVALGEDDRADALLGQARDLQRRWHDAFWMPTEGFYALAIDRDGRQVASITSNPGHALGAGIVPVTHARQVADRLLSPTLFSGWGVRTLADDHPSYNPLAYHLGGVWPVENATFVLGFKRYGLDEHVDRLSLAMFEAAAASPEGRLPEVLTGHRRRPDIGPAAYPNACSPQAWSASAVVQLLQIGLGLYPFAPLRVLALVRPRLPAWAPEVTLRNVRVGRATLDLRFERRPDGSASHQVLRRHGAVLVVESGPPADATGAPRPWLESAQLAGLRLAPGRLVRAARIALGVE
jgi:glycogen debranching enzyme